MKVYAAIIAILGWFALTAQFYINITSGVAAAPEIIIRYFSYFTLTTNLIVAVCCTALAFNPGSGWGRFFSRHTTLAAITVYIVIVGIIYNVILRFIWNPQGLQMIVDELLHSVIPVLFLLFWLVFGLKNNLKWRDVFRWLLYPLIYIIFILARGAVSGFYPYPFINVHQIGLEKALINAFGITIAFVVTSLIVVAIGKFMNKKSARAAERNIA